MSVSSEDHKYQAESSLTGNILTVHDMAAYLRLTETTVRYLAASGELPGFKIGGSWRFDRGEIMERIAAAKPKAKTAN